MYNLQSGMHRQRYPPKLTPSQAKRRQLELANQAPDNGHKTWAKGLGRHTKAVTGIQVDNLNRTVVSTGLDGRVKVGSRGTSLLCRSRLNDHAVLGLFVWSITSRDRLEHIRKCDDDEISSRE